MLPKQLEINFKRESKLEHGFGDSTDLFWIPTQLHIVSLGKLAFFVSYFRFLWNELYYFYITIV